MIYTCIGKRKDSHGRPFQCTNTSETPSNPARPDFGYLCSECLGTQYGRPVVQIETVDMDKPNAREFEPCEMHFGSRSGVKSDEFEQSEQEQIDALEELDIL